MPQPKLFSFDAIGTRWWCENLSGSTIPVAAQREILARAARFNADFTRFDDSSLVGRLNRGQTIADPPAELLALLDLSKRLYYESDGAFNISVGGELHRTGYGSRERAAPVWENPWTAIEYDAQHVSIPPNMTIDFGGLGKGWLIDSFTDILARHGVNHFIINGGGDLLVRSSQPVELALEHPFDSSRSVGATTITNGAMAVSGNAKRTWRHAGNTYAHLVDPAGSKADEPAAVYVKAATATIADAMATIVFLRPSLKQVLQKKYDLSVIVLDSSQLKN